MLGVILCHCKIKIILIFGINVQVYNAKAMSLDKYWFCSTLRIQSDIS